VRIVDSDLVQRAYTKPNAEKWNHTKIQPAVSTNTQRRRLSSPNETQDQLRARGRNRKHVDVEVVTKGKRKAVPVSSIALLGLGAAIGSSVNERILGREMALTNVNR
jgi:hypothetical protein